MSQALEEVMTMWSGHSLFAVPMHNVLSITQETRDLHCLAFKGDAAVGVTPYRDIPVNVVDLAKLSGFASVTEEKLHLVEMLKQREQDHIFWINELEKAIINDQTFAYPRDAHNCQFGQWCQSYKTEDEELYLALTDLSGPHDRLHGLADELLTLSQAGHKEQALAQLQEQRDSTLKELNHLLRRAATHIQNSIRSVYLFLTLDGNSPCIAILADEIASVEVVGDNAPVSIESMGIPQKQTSLKFIRGYIHLKSDKDCLLIDVESLGAHNNLSETTLKTG